MLSKTQHEELAEKARQMRGDIVRMLASSKSGHPGGSLSSVELLSYLYFYKMKIDPQNPKMPERDRFVLSKGHAAPVLYAALAERGFFEKNLVTTLRKFKSMIQGHPDMKRTPGVDVSSGSLGQGLSIANGMALAFKLDKMPNRVFVLMGDGEMEEGQVWEALMSTVHNKLNNVTAFVDYNGLQIDGDIEDVKSFNHLPERLKAFGWNVIEVDGHNYDEIDAAVTEAENTTDRPTFVVMHTLKGKGISFMEGSAAWHGKAPNAEEAAQALKELGFDE